MVRALFAFGVLLAATGCQEAAAASEDGAAPRVEEKPRVEKKPRVHLEYHRGEGFRIGLPLGVKLVFVGAEQKVNLYRVYAWDGAPLFTIYSGETPDLRAPRTAEITSERLGGQGVDCAVWRDGDSRECTFSRPAQGPFVHAFYEELPTNLRERADELMKNILLLKSETTERTSIE